MCVLLLQLHSYTIISNSEKRFQINGRKIKINRWPQTKYRIHRLAFTFTFIYLKALDDALLLWNSPFKTDSNRDTFSLGRILSIHFSLFSNDPAVRGSKTKSHNPLFHECDISPQLSWDFTAINGWEGGGGICARNHSLICSYHHPGA